MATITQTIPNYALGISEQPDEQKLPGQVRDAVNVVPDITDGLTKRPGTEYIATLGNVFATGSWFSYYRDDNEAYIGNVRTDGTVRVYKCSDGTEIVASPSDSAGSYLTHTNPGDIEALTINDTTFLVNKTKTVSLTSDLTTKSQKDSVAGSSPYYTADKSGHAVYVELKQIAPRRSYALNIYNTEATQELFSATTVELELSDASHSGGESNAITAPSGGDYSSDKYKDPSSSIYLHQYGPDCPAAGSRVDVNGPTGICSRITVLGQPFVSRFKTNPSPDQPQYNCQYTGRIELLYGGSYATSKINNTFNAGIVGYSHRVKILTETSSPQRGNIARIRPIPVDIEQETAISAAAVLNSLNKAINDGAGGTVRSRIIGNGLYLWSNSTFNVEALESDLFNIVTDEINDVTELPTSCRDGFIVKVSNSAAVQDDDYYLKFIGDNSKDGTGHWIECTKPEIQYKLDPTSMPYVLTRVSTSSFTVGQWKTGSTSNWQERGVGDDFTNPAPSFVGKKISKLLYHRDRLVALSDANIIMSQPGDLGNFWNNTALTFSGDDRIDISCSSPSGGVNSLVDGIEINTGLVLFSENAQYLFSTDSDKLDPQTAQVYPLSVFNYNTSIHPISLGTSLGFVDNAGKYSRFFEMLNVRRETEPEVVEQSKVVSRLLNKNLDIFTNSRENAYILMGKITTNEIFGFRYYNVSGKRLQGAWFKWKFQKNIFHFVIIQDDLYIIFDDRTLVKISLKEKTNSPTSDSYDDTFNIHLDRSTTVASSALSYSSSTDLTSFTLPSYLNEAVDVAAIVLGNNDNRGRYQVVSSTSGNGGNTVTLNGDWTANDIHVGEQYEMKVEFPTIYATSTKNKQVTADTTSSLIVQRIRFNFGDVGQFITKLVRIGKPDFIDTHESSILDAYQANRLPYVGDSSRTIPVYERNENVNVTLTSTHPSPATLQSMSWEGDYNNRFYKRI